MKKHNVLSLLNVVTEDYFNNNPTCGFKAA